MWAIVNDQGTAMAESALCDEHIKDDDHRAFAYAVAIGADDLTSPPPITFAFVNCSGNDTLTCVECLIDDGTNGQDRESYIDTQDRESYTTGEVL